MVSHLGHYDDKSLKKALGMFRLLIRSVRGHAAIFAWSDLIVDRSRKLIDLLSLAACATHAGGDSDLNFENCDIFHAQSPDTGRGVNFSDAVLGCTCWLCCQMAPGGNSERY